MPAQPPRSPVGAVLLAALATASVAPRAETRPAACPAEMALVGNACVDRWEGSLVELDARGKERGPFSPYRSPRGVRVRARARAGVVPQAHVSRNDAEAACREAGKRLCTDQEWLAACRGKAPTTFPYGDEEREGYCNDRGISPLLKLFGPARDELFGYEAMNDPRLNQVPGTVAKTGAFRRCRSSYGTQDMVGNLHEWTDDPRGTFRGGYYLDTRQNGLGCAYVTRAHAPAYHDYSTGFRCCRDPARAGRTRRK